MWRMIRRVLLIALVVIAVCIMAMMAHRWNRHRWEATEYVVEPQAPHGPPLSMAASVVTFNVEPPDAEIIVNGIPRGMVPCRLGMSPLFVYRIRIRYTGTGRYTGHVFLFQPKGGLQTVNIKLAEVGPALVQE